MIDDAKETTPKHKMLRRPLVFNDLLTHFNVA